MLVYFARFACACESVQSFLGFPSFMCGHVMQPCLELQRRLPSGREGGGFSLFNLATTTTATATATTTTTTTTTSAAATTSSTATY